jgi:two-component system cell cycle sensor histidine kinase/response regulator CckA
MISHRPTTSSVVGVPRHVRVALGTGVLSLLCAALFVMVSLHESDDALHRVKRSQEMDAAVGSLRGHLLQAESAHRSYLLVDSEAALANYQRADRGSVADLANVHRLGNDLPGGRYATAALDASVRELVDFRKRVITAQRESGPAAARALLVARSAQDANASVDAALTDLENLERAFAKLGVERERQASQRAVEAVLIALLIALLFGFWSVHALRAEGMHVARSEQRYRTLAQANPDGVFVLVDGRFVYANSAAMQLFGAPSKQVLLGESFAQFVKDEDRVLAERLIEGPNDSDTLGLAQALRIQRFDGATSELEVQCAAIDFESVHALQFVARDVTTRREAELILLLSEQRLRAVIDGMAEGLMLADESGKVQLWNAAAERLLGQNAEQITGRSPGTEQRVYAASGVQLDDYRHHMRRALAERAPSTGQIVIVRADREPTWLRVSAIPLCHEGDTRPYAVVGTYADVTATELATRKLQESEARYRLLADNTADLVSRRDLADRFEYASPSHEAVLGWKPEELIGRAGYELVHREDRERVSAAAEAAQRDTQVPVPVPARFQTRQGNYIWLELVVSSIRNADGVETGRLFSARDINARRQLEEQLHRSQKMESMGRMAGAVAHDFNNLLTIIRTSVELIRGASPGSEQDQAGQEILQAVERASALTTQLLAFCRGQHSSPSEVAIAPLVRATCRLLRRLTRSDCELELVIDPAAESAGVRAERVSLEQVLLNLVSNANDAMPEGGSIRVVCSVARIDQPINHKFGTIPEGEYATFTVADSGTGISDHVLMNIFEPFFTTKPQGKGTGLGLSTVYGIVQQAQGSVVVDGGGPERGARFTVYWPLVANVDESGPVAIPNTGPIALPHPVALRASDAPAPLILLVEDEPSVRRLVSRLLERFGYEVLVAESGVAGLELLRAGQHSVRALICDVRMPGMGGVELFQKLVSLGKTLPVLFISGQLDANLPEVGYAGLAPRLLTKPFRSQDLEREVQALLAESA